MYQPSFNVPSFVEAAVKAGIRTPGTSLRFIEVTTEARRVKGRYALPALRAEVSAHDLLTPLYFARKNISRGKTFSHEGRRYLFGSWQLGSKDERLHQTVVWTMTEAAYQTFEKRLAALSAEERAALERKVSRH